MAKKKNEISLIDAIASLEESREINSEVIAEAVKNAFARAYVKTYFPSGSDGVVVRADVDSNNKFAVYFGRIVTKEEEIEDDLLQISIDDEEVVASKLNLGDLYEEVTTFDEIQQTPEFKKFIESFKANFSHRIKDIEKQALIEKYGSKQGELVTGRVVQYNRHTGEAVIEIDGKVELPLESREKIGDESFTIGELVKVCIISITSTQTGAQIVISRSSPLYLRRLFEHEVNEVYANQVIIQNIAREAGSRSKVAVYSTEPDIDPCGACIGPDGARIKAITSSLGNSSTKEKIDIVKYEENLHLFIAEALLPGTIVGVSIEEKLNNETGKVERKAIAVCKNGDMSTSVGKDGVNVRLAARLVGLNSITVMEQDNAFAQGIKFKSIDQIRNGLNANEETEQAIQEEFDLDSAQYDDYDTDDVEVNETVETEEVEAKVEKPSVEEVKEPEVIEKVEITDTLKMDDLLSKLESEKANQSKVKEKDFKKKTYKKRNDEETVVVEPLKEDAKKEIKGMAIYTEDELKELEAEETNASDVFDEDYDDYDEDSYYDED